MSTYDAVVGIWDGHDCGAALVVDGRVELALNEERLSGRKLDVGFPSRCLEAIVTLTKGRRVAYAPCTSDPAKTLTRVCPWMKEDYYKLRRRLLPPGRFYQAKQGTKYFLTQLPTNAFFRNWASRHFSAALGVSREDVFLIDHHQAHAASAVFWPAWAGQALVVTLDGIGDGESGSVWQWDEARSELSKLLSIPGAASLGLFFEHVTQQLQMRPLEDEGKVMALATYAAEIPNEKNPFLGWFSLGRNAEGLPLLECRIRPTRMASEVAKVIWCTPREQVCRMAQQTVEALVPRFFSMLAEARGCGHFAYAGGVASNIKVNRLIRNSPGVESLRICPAMGDGGLALGAALSAWHSLTGKRPLPFDDFRLGSAQLQLDRDVATIAAKTGAKLSQPENLPAAVAELVAAGEVVMWAQGRMELGARALGARSIVARADSIRAKDDLNLRLKRRVWFQPFCPSMLRSEAERLLCDFRGPQDINLHMTCGYMTTPEGAKALAGAIGHDGSCRPQMVDDAREDGWARLLREVRQRTGTGAVINTSLNMHGKPMSDDYPGIVEAWVDSGVKHLALGGSLLSKA